MQNTKKKNWPESKLHLPPEIQDYFLFKDLAAHFT